MWSIWTCHLTCQWLIMYHSFRCYSFIPLPVWQVDDQRSTHCLTYKLESSITSVIIILFGINIAQYLRVEFTDRLEAFISVYTVLSAKFKVFHLITFAHSRLTPKNISTKTLIKTLHNVAVETAPPRVVTIYYWALLKKTPLHVFHTESHSASSSF